jgi:hypothetical protein
MLVILVFNAGTYLPVSSGSERFALQAELAIKCTGKLNALVNALASHFPLELKLYPIHLKNIFSNEVGKIQKTQYNLQ